VRRSAADEGRGRERSNADPSVLSTADGMEAFSSFAELVIAAMLE
jgi:hypothetical protein